MRAADSLLVDAAGVALVWIAAQPYFLSLTNRRTTLDIDGNTLNRLIRRLGL